MLERYELLYEAGLVDEAVHDRGAGRPRADAGAAAGLGEPMALDHRRLLATALGRLRGKLKYRPVVFELLPQTFTLLRLQRVVEALAGVRLHKQNFRRLVETRRPGRGDGRDRARPGGSPGGALPLPPRGAARAPGARRGPAGPSLAWRPACLDFYALN